jgi:acetyl esterase/lipase
MQVSHKLKDGSNRGGWPSLNLSHMDENCLFLNIYSPISAVRRGSTELLPVMVYFHAGEFWAGSGNDAENNFPYAAFAKRAVLVTVNWRLGPFGYLASDDLRTRSSDNSTGNYGQQDQRAALSWLKHNIGAFGGNGSNVLIFGESSGGTVVGAHLANPRSWGLFHKAVLESPGLTQVKSFSEAKANHDYLVSTLAAIGSPGCLFRNRTRGVMRTINSSNGGHFGEVAHLQHEYTRYDGVTLRGKPFKIWKNTTTFNITQDTVCADAAVLVGVQAQAYCDQAFASGRSSQSCTSFMLTCTSQGAAITAALQSAQVDVEVEFFASTAHISNRDMYPCTAVGQTCSVTPSSFVATAELGAAGTDCLLRSNASDLHQLMLMGSPFAANFSVDAWGPTIDGVDMNITIMDAIEQTLKYPPLSVLPSSSPAATAAPPAPPAPAATAAPTSPAAPLLAPGVPVLGGSNLDEGTMFMHDSPPIAKNATFEDFEQWAVRSTISQGVRDYLFLVAAAGGTGGAGGAGGAAVAARVVGPNVGCCCKGFVASIRLALGPEMA